MSGRIIASGVGVLATLGVLFQTGHFLMGFGWAWIHGAGAGSFFAILPAAIGIALLWAGYAVIRAPRVERPAGVFCVYAVCVLLLSEVLLPVTPLKNLRSQRALERVVVRDVRDEPFLTARGNPIGVRIEFDAVFPETGAYSIGPAALMPAEGDVPYELQFGHSRVPVIDPKPSPDREDLPRVFSAGVVYTLTHDMMPNFVVYHDESEAPCLNLTTGRPDAERRFLAALSGSGRMKYRTEIQVQGQGYPSRRRLAGVHVTHAYDVRSIYETLAIEGNVRCQQ